MPLPDALNPGFHGVRTPWIRDFMAFQAGRAVSNPLDPSNPQTSATR